MKLLRFYILVFVLSVLQNSYAQVPPAPVLYSPPDNSGVYCPFNLVWYRVQTAVNYRVRISTNAGFTTTVLDDTLSDSVRTISCGPLGYNTLWYWRVSARNGSGAGSWSAAWRFWIIPTGVRQIETEVPAEFKLYQNFPNPFNPVTRIKFNLPSPGNKGASPLALKVYNALGLEVAVLVNEELKPGTYEVEWGAGNFPSGVYYCTLVTAGFRQTRKMVLMK